SGVILFLLGEQMRRTARLVIRLGWVAVVAILTREVLSDHWPRCGDGVILTVPLYTTTPDDLALVAWCDEHLPREAGWIGLAAGAGRGGMDNQEKQVVGLSGMPAFLLHGQTGNYRFAMHQLDTRDACDDYIAHI